MVVVEVVVLIRVVVCEGALVVIEVWAGLVVVVVRIVRDVVGDEVCGAVPLSAVLTAVVARTEDVPAGAVPAVAEEVPCAFRVVTEVVTAAADPVVTVAVSVTEELSLTAGSDTGGAVVRGSEGSPVISPVTSVTL